MAAQLPRFAILEESLRNLRLLRVESTAQAVAISNRYAPEHLIINCDEAPIGLLNGDVTAAGSVFLGAMDTGIAGRLLLRHQSRVADLWLRAAPTAACP